MTAIINVIIDFALRLGVPYLLKVLPWLPANLVQIVEDFINSMEGHSAAVTATVTSTREKIKTDIMGMDPPADLH